MKRKRKNSDLLLPDTIARTNGKGPESGSVVVAIFFGGWIKPALGNEFLGVGKVGACVICGILVDSYGSLRRSFRSDICRSLEFDR